MIQPMRKVHKYLGLAAAIVIIVVTLTGILLIHKKTLGLDKVSLRAPGYGDLRAAPDASELLVQPTGDIVIGTKQGVYVRSGTLWTWTFTEQVKKLYQRDNSIYACAKKGLFASTDSGKTWTMLFNGGEVKTLRFEDGRILAATLKGIFSTPETGPAEWTKVAAFEPNDLDVRDFRMVDDGLLIIAKEGVFTAAAGGDLMQAPLAAEERRMGTIELQKLITDLHTGEFFGKYFFTVIDASAVGIIVLTVSGIYLWYFPRKLRLRNRW